MSHALFFNFSQGEGVCLLKWTKLLDSAIMFYFKFAECHTF